MNRVAIRRGGTASVGRITLERAGPVHRVTADVNGAPLWFESTDIALVPAPEAFGSAMLIPALHHRARLSLADALDPVWSENVLQIVSVLHRWWGFPAWPPQAPLAEGDRGTERRERALEGGQTALFFSGGVDSFHRLLRGDTPVDWLVTLWGFDFPLDDRVRGEAVEAGVRQIASATGKRAALVRTNAREHPLVRDTPWERAHGGILAAVAHLLAPTVTRAIISSSAPGDRDIPFGSHWRIDPFWSSSRTAMRYEGRGERRIDKLRAIAADALVHEHLRVCYRNSAPIGNCSRCSKCVFAMLVLEECGELEPSRVFEGRSELASRIDALPKALQRSWSVEELRQSPNLSPALRTSARELVRRTRYAERPDVRLRRAVVGWLLTRLGLARSRGDSTPSARKS